MKKILTLLFFIIPSMVFGADFSTLTNINTANNINLDTAYSSASTFLSAWKTVPETIEFDAIKVYHAIQATSTDDWWVVIYDYDSGTPLSYGSIVAVSDINNTQIEERIGKQTRCTTPISEMTEDCFTELTFSSPVTLLSSEQYAIELQTDYGGSIYWGFANDSLYSGSPPDTDRLRFCSGGTCSSNFSGDNMIWKINGTPAVPTVNGILGGENQDTEIISPLHATNTASTTFDIIINYDNADGKYTHLTYLLYSTLTFKNLVEFQTVPVSAIVGQFNYTTTHSQGNYAIEAYLFDNDTALKDLPIAEVTFSVIENPLGEIIGIDPDDYETIIGLATTTCSITNLTGCFQNALIFTFYPSAASLQNFSNLKETIEKKPPFGYFSLLTGTLDNLTEGATPVFALEEEGNVSTNIFDPLRTGMTWLLWLVFGVWLYKRITHIEV